MTTADAPVIARTMEYRPPVDFSKLPVQYVKFITKRRFGIELEVNKKVSLDTLVKAVKEADHEKECASSSSYIQDHGNNYWHCKFDRSCGNKTGEGGWEVASYVASGAADLLKISAIGPVLKKAGAEVNNNCGYHIHVEIKDFSTDQAATMIAYWMKIEPIIGEILPKTRKATTDIYARALRDLKPVTDRDLRSAEYFWNRVKPLSQDNVERRSALNMCNYCFSGQAKRTVELRLPEGTLDEVDIKNWARMFIHFVNYCKKAKFPGNVDPVTTLREAAIILGLHNEEPFYILSKGLYETKVWFLNRALKFSGKKPIRTEASDFLNFIVPQTPIKSPMTRESYVDDEATAATVKTVKKKKEKVAVKAPSLQLNENDYWEPFEED